MHYSCRVGLTFLLITKETQFSFKLGIDGTDREIVKVHAFLSKREIMDLNVSPILAITKKKKKIYIYICIYIYIYIYIFGPPHNSSSILSKLIIKYKFIFFTFNDGSL